MVLRLSQYSKSLPSTPKDPFVLVRPIRDDAYTEKQTPRPAWRPVTLRRPFLAFMVFLTTLLIAAISLLLVLSNRYQGMLFAQDVNNIPFRRSFCYLYLPTIISVIYSFLWTWVDLDIKRLEPYFQLSRGPVSAENSILLSYPLEFLVTVPLSAFKRKHWTVLSGSVIMMFVFWGLTPTQAGIFAVRTITLNEQTTGAFSTTYTSIPQQGNLSADFAQSVYNIAWLNETLPPFMTREYVLSPFGLSRNAATTASNITYLGNTTLYSVDVACTPATLLNTSLGYVYNSSEGCGFPAPSYRPFGGSDPTKPYDTLYVGYQNENGFADYDLYARCTDQKFFHMFFVRWSKISPAAVRADNQSHGIDPDSANDTSLFCQASYYQQRVNALIKFPSQEVITVSSHGDKVPLPEDMFNVSTFEWAMNSGQEQFPMRGDYPTSGFPDQKSQLLSLPLNLEYIPKMSPFAIAAHRLPLEEYLDPDQLRSSYEAAYRLLFARQLVDILNHELDLSTGSHLDMTYTTQAVVVVPDFAIAALVLLCIVLLLALGLLITAPRRYLVLREDPSSIGALMDLSCSNSDIVKFLSCHEGSNTAALTTSLKNIKSSMRRSKSSSSSVDAQPMILMQQEKPRETWTSINKSAAPTCIADYSYQGSKNGVRPAEMKLFTGMVFFLLQVAALTVFAKLFIQARREDGLPLPSSSTFVRQLVQNYIPIVLATLIEPFWLVLNRYLCMLQPFEELRRGGTSASRSVDLDYSSLPPQMSFVTALRARHFVMVLVCFMVLLANVLAVALSGLMYEEDRFIVAENTFTASKYPQMRALNGTGLPFNSNQSTTFQGGSTNGPFYAKMSNLTAGTPTPAWTDDQFAYIPVTWSAVYDNATSEVPTIAYGAELSCGPISQHGEQNYRLSFDEFALTAKLEVNVQQEDGTSVTCTDDNGYIYDNQEGHVALEFATMLSSNASAEKDLFCRQHVLACWMRANWNTNPGSASYYPGIEATGTWNMSLTSRNETVLLCRPRIIVAATRIVVDLAGQVLQRTYLQELNQSSTRYFRSSTDNLAAQANLFLADRSDRGTWHKDDYPSDFLNYLIKRSTNDASLLDYLAPVPLADHAAMRLSDIYQKLFALLISENLDLLFEDADPLKGSLTIGGGKSMVPQTRILFSTPAFMVTEIILGLYIFTTALFYARRPWRILPRLPSSPASIMAYFAASHALRKMSILSIPNERRAARARSTWTYGSFIGNDGHVHIGIDGDPLVTWRAYVGIGSESDSGSSSGYKSVR